LKFCVSDIFIWPKNDISEKPITSDGSQDVKISLKDLDEIVPPPRNEISEKTITSDGSQKVKIALKDFDQTVPPPPLVPPPPFPPDDIPQEAGATKTRVVIAIFTFSDPLDAIGFSDISFFGGETISPKSFNGIFTF
jgi:hypothetical protein